MWKSEDSDDDVFFGELSLREVKRSLCYTSKQRQTLSTTYTKKTTEDDDKNKSIRIIVTHSTPDIHSVWSSDAESSNKDNQSTSDNQDTDNNLNTKEAPCYADSVLSENELSHMEPLSYQNVTSCSLLSNLDGHGHKPDDSFLQIEKLVTDLSLKTPNKVNEIQNELVTDLSLKTPNKVNEIQDELVTDLSLKTPNKVNEIQDEELDNTLDVIEYILKNGPSNDSSLKHADSKSLQDVQETPTAKETEALKTQSAIITPVKTVSAVNIMKSSGSKLKTPSTKTSAFKTPGFPVSNRKQMVTPLKKQFNHVVSPVASYINDSPVVPLLKNVRPKKPLNGSSFIPQPIKNPSKINVVNKENQNLPCTAYRSAKTTRVIDYPEEQRLPQSQWAKHVASSMQKGVVMRHIHRENNAVKKPPFQQQEDSFSNLTMHQADLSVCTQKSAVKKAL